VIDMGGVHAAETELFDLANLQLKAETYYYIVRLPSLRAVLSTYRSPTICDLCTSCTLERSDLIWSP